MNYRWLASAALALTSLGFVGGTIGCSAAPGDPALASTNEALVIFPTCTTPFTAAEESCFKDGAGRTICSRECTDVTQSPGDPSAQNMPGFILADVTPIAAPAPLAAIGCTWGIQNGMWGSFWACPASAQLPISSSGNMPVSCLSSDDLAKPEDAKSSAGSDCAYQISYGPDVTPNAVFGDADSGWVLVEGLYHEGSDYVNLMGCEGGCPMVGSFL